MFGLIGGLAKSFASNVLKPTLKSLATTGLSILSDGIQKGSSGSEILGNLGYTAQNYLSSGLQQARDFGRQQIINPAIQYAQNQADRYLGPGQPVNAPTFSMGGMTRNVIPVTPQFSSPQMDQSMGINYPQMGTSQMQRQQQPYIEFGQGFQTGSGYQSSGIIPPTQNYSDRFGQMSNVQVNPGGVPPSIYNPNQFEANF